MGNVSEKVEAASNVSQQTEAPKKLKPCCACPETKKVRDECIILNGEENCKHLIEAHKECMRKAGFNI
ncbi:cytochrome c oxidase copper chaperone-like [Leptinotarsa decemlineata]|uniref:cytochrome c oxidase copper chaperone-like n=1 Tax=Leptinotarsa decemlineata TaxID=7539 RepID=UPI003D3062EC